MITGCVGLGLTSDNDYAAFFTGNGSGINALIDSLQQDLIAQP